MRGGGGAQRSCSRRMLAEQRAEAAVALPEGERRGRHVAGVERLRLGLPGCEQVVQIVDQARHGVSFVGVMVATDGSAGRMQCRRDSLMRPRMTWLRRAVRPVRRTHVRVTWPGGGWLCGLLPLELIMSSYENGVDDPTTPPNGVKAPGKDHAAIQDGPAQDSEIDDDDAIEDEVDAEVDLDDDDKDEEDEQ